MRMTFAVLVSGTLLLVSCGGRAEPRPEPATRGSAPAIRETPALVISATSSPLGARGTTDVPTPVASVTAAPLVAASATASTTLTIVEAPTADRTGTSDAADKRREPFRMVVQTVFSIRGRGTVVTGRVERGTVRVLDMVRILWPGGALDTTVIGVERQQQAVDEAAAGDEIWLLLQGVEPESIPPGALVEQPDQGAATAPAAEQRFRMVIQEVDVIRGRGTVVSGHVERGTIHVMDHVRITGESETIETVVISIIVDRQSRDEATAGDAVRLLLRGVESDRVIPGSIVEAVPSR
jgi:translation elongation factor EF-Tu-like GTPase